MYARVLTAQAQPGKIDEVAQVVRNSVLPVAKQQPGFKGLLHLVDHLSGKGIAITLWETEADMKAGETSGYLQEQLLKVAPLLAAAPIREAYEVNVQV